MVRPLAAMVLLLSLVTGAPRALACEKHINGHQNNSDTNAEAVQK
jgi:hypothetical protein